MSEPGRQFDEIFREYNDPKFKKRRQMKRNREARAEKIKEDAGL